MRIKSVTDLLAGLVDIPSETGHEATIAEFVTARLRAAVRTAAPPWRAAA